MKKTHIENMGDWGGDEEAAMTRHSFAGMDVGFDLRLHPEHPISLAAIEWPALIECDGTSGLISLACETEEHARRFLRKYGYYVCKRDSGSTSKPNNHIILTEQQQQQPFGAERKIMRWPDYHDGYSHGDAAEARTTELADHERNLVAQPRSNHYARGFQDGLAGRPRRPPNDAADTMGDKKKPGPAPKAERDLRIVVRAPRAERDEIRRRAAAAQKSTSRYLVDAGLGRKK